MHRGDCVGGDLASRQDAVVTLVVSVSVCFHVFIFLDLCMFVCLFTCSCNAVDNDVKYYLFFRLWIAV